MLFIGSIQSYRQFSNNYNKNIKNNSCELQIKQQDKEYFSAML